MLRSANELEGYKILASDGEFARANMFLFNDNDWTIQYLVVNTGSWLKESQVLIPPQVLGIPDWSTQRFPINLSKEWIESAPEITEDMPVSRQKLVEMLSAREGVLPVVQPRPTNPVAVDNLVRQQEEGTPKNKVEGDPHLRSTREITGYDIHATDGSIGHVEDFIADLNNWIIRYIIVDTRNWLPGGKKVLISPNWVDNISWVEHKVKVDFSRQQTENSPEFNPDAPINREYEIQLYDYYGRPKYW